MATRGGARNVRKRPLPNIVPSILVSYIQGTQPQDMALCDCYNNAWHLKIEKFGGDWYFTDGWVDFVKDNMIKGGDVLFYQYSSRGLLNFKILGPSSSEDDRIERLEYRTTKLQDVKIEVKAEDEEAADDIDKNPPKKRDDHHQKDKVVDAEDVEGGDNFDNNPPRKRDDHPRKQKVDAGASSSMRRKKRKNQDYYGTEIFCSGRVRQPKNPYFVTEVRGTRVNEMYIPAEVARYYDFDLPAVMMLVDPEGRKFQMRRTCWKDGRLIYCGGWRGLCRLNLAREVDKLICEFVRGEDGDLQIEVSIFRAK